MRVDSSKRDLTAPCKPQTVCPNVTIKMMKIAVAALLACSAAAFAPSAQMGKVSLPMCMRLSEAG